MTKMTKLLLILMVVGLWSGCGKDSPTGEEEKELLTWTTTYDDGKVKEEYQYYQHPDNGKRIKEGWYNSYYESGEVEWEGNYKNGNKDGKWISNDETGNLIDEDTYREGLCVESCEWRKTFEEGGGRSVQQTVDGGFIVSGWDGGEVLLLKTDGQGNEQWRNTLGEGGGSSVQQTVDGGFIVSGWDRDYDLFLLKTYELGYIEDLDSEATDD